MLVERSTSTRPVRAARPSLTNMARAGASSLGLAVAGSLTLYAVGRATGWLTASAATDAVAASEVPGLLAVLGMSIAAPIVATALFALLVRFAPRPGAIFLALAASVYAGFLPGPILLNAPIMTTVMLEAMHLAVAIPVVAHLLGTLAPRAGASAASQVASAAG